MSGELEAAGALATAGLAAGAIEGRGPHGGDHGGTCINCGAEITGPFCAQCGQASHPHRSLTHVVEEFLHGVLHFDTKAWRTLPMVIFRPGTLTRNYVYGKRARYISPLALFLFTIFFMFFVFAFVPPGGSELPVNISAGEATEDLAQVREDLADARAELAELRAQPQSADGLEAGITSGVGAVLEGEVTRLEQEVARLEAEQAGAETSAAAQAPASEQAPAAEGAAATTPAAADATPPATAEGAESSERVVTADNNVTWQDRARENAQSEDFVVVSGWDSFNEKVRHKLENPDLALYKIQQAAYKFSFLLAPLSLPFIALLFLWKRGVTLYDHIVYALYALSFASLLFVAIIMAAQHPWTSWLVGWLIMAAHPVHTYFHLKGAYALGWFSALWRTIIMLNFAAIIALLFLIIIIVLGLAN